MSGSHGQDGTDASRQQHHALGWRTVQEQLRPVRHKWGLAILCNLGEADGRRPADLVAAINCQAGRTLITDLERALRIGRRLVAPRDLRPSGISHLGPPICQRAGVSRALC
jgi:hypothetical protein